MARDSESSATGQSKRPSTIHFGDSSDHVHQQTTTHTHRVKSQKHIVGGGASRLHARVPSSKALHKYHASASTAKLNRRHGTSLSPERGSGLTQQHLEQRQQQQQQQQQHHHHHRRATSELKLTPREPPASNLKKNTSTTSLKRNRSHVDVGKKTKSTTSLHKSVSNPAVDKLRTSGGSSKVHFNLGDAEDDDDQDDEWVDASTSASPLLSRRGSTISGNAQPTHPPPLNRQIPAVAPPTSHQDDPHEVSPTSKPPTASTNISRDTSFISNAITSKVLSRVPSHGAPPKMSTETVSVRASTSLQQSSAESSLGRSIQPRPGSSGRAELTSRFIGHNSQEPGSEIPVDSYMLAAANKGGLTRAALGKQAETTIPRRPRSMGSLSHAQDAMRSAAADYDSDDHGGEGPNGARSNRNGGFVNRTQQKLDLQRASSDVAPKHPYGILGYGPDGVAVGAPEPKPWWAYVTRPYSFAARSGPAFQKALERTGLEWLAIRRYYTPHADSIKRIKNLPGSPYHHKDEEPTHHEPSRPQSRRSATELIAGRPATSSGMPDGQHHEHEPVEPSSASARRPFSSLRVATSSVASSYGTDDGNGDGVGARLMNEHQQQRQRRLSGSSYTEMSHRFDPEVRAVLRMMWAQPNDQLTASEE
ncbi:hypothetical protein QBC35DRAFT_146477 [Podospora australis]|uniref:Uncharacterized protein n=1 Tax=Podospora australis TaxID=1536484 RepID=A0AAN7AI17_9PEZI|nr:hypothetical protein QBC35DRAFT_146477 [Podospora australis]